jgi:hypothetical protein
MQDILKIPCTADQGSGGRSGEMNADGLGHARWLAMRSVRIDMEGVRNAMRSSQATNVYIWVSNSMNHSIKFPDRKTERRWPLSKEENTASSSSAVWIGDLRR